MRMIYLIAEDFEVTIRGETRTEIHIDSSLFAFESREAALDKVGELNSKENEARYYPVAVMFVAA